MKRKKVLTVDDSSTILMMEKLVLAKAGFELITAQNGEEAVAKAIEHLPDLILMDVVMPKMNGFEAVRRIRATETTAHIPIIMVTTRGEAENVETGWKSGCDDYVTKPIDTVELLAKVKSALGTDEAVVAR